MHLGLQKYARESQCEMALVSSVTEMFNPFIGDVGRYRGEGVFFSLGFYHASAKHGDSWRDLH